MPFHGSNPTPGGAAVPAAPRRGRHAGPCTRLEGSAAPVADAARTVVRRAGPSKAMGERDGNPGSARHAGRALALACTMLLAAGCTGGGDGGPPAAGGLPAPVTPPASGSPPAPGSPNPTGLEFRPTPIGVPAAPDGRNYRSAEYMGHWGLDAISADGAYERGYFGQGVTIAVADDGMDPTHPDLAGRITAPRHVINGDARVFEPGYGGRPGEGHGTFVALVAAGARANAGGPFEIDIAGGASIPTKNAHGVAPQASVMPIQLAGGGQPAAAIRHATANRAQVLNFSIGVSQHYYGEYAGRDGVWLTVGKPLFRPLLSLDLGRHTSAFPGEFRKAARSLEHSDITLVWAAGNDGWNSVNNEVRMCGKNFIGEDGCALGEGPVSAEAFMANFSWLYDEHDLTRRVSFRDMWGDCGSEDCADYNSASAWLVAPLFEPGLLGKWLVVGALDRNGEIARFSNGCGEARNWCLFAPGVDLAVGTDRRGNLTGTSFAAPMASGALAVLKSRLPSMPMEVVQAVLLVSADPLGTRLTDPGEPDPVYGWGRLNLGRAVSMQGTVRLPYAVAGTAETTQGVLLRDARVDLSPALAHVGERLQAVEVAVAGVGHAYYNMPLAGTVAMADGDAPPLGYAARDLLASAAGRRLGHAAGAHGAFAEFGVDAGDVQVAGMDVSAGALGRWRLRYGLCDGCEGSAWGERNAIASGAVAAAPFFARAGGAVALQMHGRGVRPFAAAGDGGKAGAAPWHQAGLRWRHAVDGFVSVAEASRIDEDRSVWGARFGALGATRTGTVQNRVLLSAPLGAAWRGLVGYERSAAEVSAGGGLLSGISGLRAEGWWAETRGGGVWRRGDVVRFAVRRATGVTGGQASIDHVVAGGSSFAEAFYRRLPQSLERKRTVIDLHARPATRYALGYGLPLGDRAQVAVGLEYEEETAERAASAHLQVSF